MKKHLKTVLCLCGMAALIGCNSYPDAVIAVRDLTPKEPADTLRVVQDSIISQDTVSKIDASDIPLSMRAANKKKASEVSFLYNYFSGHFGYGSMKASDQFETRKDDCLTFHMDYERYFKKCPGLSIGMFWSGYAENNDLGLYDQDIFITSFGPKLGYKIRYGKVLFGAGAGIGPSVLSSQIHSGNKRYSESTVGFSYMGTVGMEIIPKSNFAFSLQYQFMRSSFSDKDLIIGDGKLTATRSAVLFGVGYYF